MRIGLVALSLSVGAAACGHLPPCPAAGGPAWIELEGTHFRLRTDEDPAAARALLTDLEHLQASLLTIFTVPTLDTGRLPVVVVNQGWTDFARLEVEGYFTRALFQPLIVMRGDGVLARQEVIKHELVHYLTAKIMPRQPLWLAEGLATYYETIEYDPDTGKLTVGRPSFARLRTARRLGARTIESMFTATSKGPDEGVFYAAAWITTHYLMNHRPEAMLRYQQALRHGASPADAWTAGFGSDTPGRIAADVEMYVVGGQYAMLLYDTPKRPPAAPVERRLSDADAHATRALLFLTGGKSGGGHETHPGDPMDEARLAGRRELDEARHQEPGHAVSRAIAHWMLREPVDLAQTTALSELGGDDWLTWMLLAEGYRQHGNAAGFVNAVMRAVETARADPSVELPVVVRKP